MPRDQLLLVILGLVVLANVLLLALIPLRAHVQRRSVPLQSVQPGSRRAPATAIAQPPADRSTGARVDLPGRGEPRSDQDARAAAAIEAFVADVTSDAAGRARAPVPSETIASDDVDDLEPSTILTMRPPARSPAALDYAPAGLADREAWDRTLREESARVARFGRPVTVVMAEIPDLDGVADRLGRGVAERVVTETARLLLANGRAADRIAWLGDARFGILLSETEEASAAGYTDRARAAADGWLESAGLSVRLSLGWASPAQGLDVMAAAAAAHERMQERMHDGGRRPASRAPRTRRRRV